MRDGADFANGKTPAMAQRSYESCNKMGDLALAKMTSRINLRFRLEKRLTDVVHR